MSCSDCSTCGSHCGGFRILDEFPPEEVWDMVETMNEVFPHIHFGFNEEQIPIMVPLEAEEDE